MDPMDGMDRVDEVDGQGSAVPLDQFDYEHDGADTLVIGRTKEANGYGV